MKEKKNNISMQLFVATCALIVALVVLGQFANAKADCVILNEVCCYNDTIIHDTIGTYRDYIELYNPTESDKDIGGFYLSDDKHNLNKYIIPENVVLKSGGYIFFWAGTWTTGVLIEDASFYTGFSLRAGETIYLSDADGNVLDKVKIPNEIDENVAYSRIDGLNNEWEMTQASPGWENYESLKKEVACLDEEVIFSVNSGFYSEPFYLEMATASEYDIFYTVDGSTPTTESMKYKEPIWITDASANTNRYSAIEYISLDADGVYVPAYNVEKGTVVRAIAVDSDGTVSKENCASYFVNFDEKEGFENITTISLVTDPGNLFDYETGIYVPGELWEINMDRAIDASMYWEHLAPANYLCKGKGWHREARIQYFDELGKLVYDQQIELGMHGRHSLINNQKSFNLYAMSEVDGKEYLFEGIFGQRERTLMLRNGGGKDCYLSKIRDVLNQDVIRDRNLLVSDFKPCQVFIDGEYWGLYMLQERIAESMVSSHFSVDEDNVIIIKSGELVAGKDEELELWNDVIEFAKSNDLFFEKNYRKMEKMIDIQSCIDFYCFEVYIANCDCFVNNYSMWRVRNTGVGEYEDGRWRWAVYDTDKSAGCWGAVATADVNSFVEGNGAHNLMGDEFFLALIRNEEFKQRFVTTFMDMANHNFDSEIILARLDELSGLLGDAMVTSQKRIYSENYTIEDYQEEIEVLKTFFVERYDYISTHLKTFLLLEGELVPIEVKNSMGGVVKLNTLTLDEGEEFIGKYYSDYCIDLVAEPQEGYEFAGWNIDGEVYEEDELSLELFDEWTIIPMWEKVE